MLKGTDQMKIIPSPTHTNSTSLVIDYFTNNHSLHSYTLTMPINGEYTWSETTDKIEISIPLKGVSVKKVDVFTTSKQLKISYSPFLLDVNTIKGVSVKKVDVLPLLNN